MRKIGIREPGSRSTQLGEPLAYGHPVRVEAGELLQAELPVLGLVEHGRPHGPSRLPRQKDVIPYSCIRLKGDRQDFEQKKFTYQKIFLLIKRELT
jgi:hypothetical protein